jgi:probable rRNA maturation factor
MNTDDGRHRAITHTTVVVDTPRRLRRSELQQFAENARRTAKLSGAVTVLLTDSATLKGLNRRYRGKSKATDVLSFPSDFPGSSGDLAISVDIAAEQATHLGHSLTKEICVLILHGMLHLAGHDHEMDAGEMAALESRLRRRFGLPLSLTERGDAREHRVSRSRA